MIPASTSGDERPAPRTLWSESPLRRARRRCRTLVATPFAALAGLTWGVFAAPAMRTGSALFWGALGAVSMPVLVHLEQRVMPVVAALARRAGLGSGLLPAMAVEAGAVSGLVYFLTSVLGAPIAPAVGTALGIGAFYTVTMEYVLCGGAAQDMLGLLHGAGAVSGARTRTHAHADALLARGEVDAAIDAYGEALAASPRDASLYVRLARAQERAGHLARALRTLRDGVRQAKLTEDQHAYLVRQILHLCHSELDDPWEAEKDLRGLLDRVPAGVHADWARRELEGLSG